MWSTAKRENEGERGGGEDGEKRGESEGEEVEKGGINKRKRDKEEEVTECKPSNVRFFQTCHGKSGTNGRELGAI